MAAVIAGMTVLQLAQLGAALGAGGASFVTLYEKLKADGCKDANLVPAEHMETVSAALHQAGDAAQFNPTVFMLTPDQRAAP